MNLEELHVHIERGLETLRREFADTITAEHVTSIGNNRFERLIKDAKIVEFIPLLVYRETREALLVSQPDAFDREPIAPVGNRRPLRQTDG